MQQIAARQTSRRQQGLQPELQVAGAGAGAAANDAAAIAAAGNETEEDGGGDGGGAAAQNAAPVSSIRGGECAFLAKFAPDALISAMVFALPLARRRAGF